jgi:DNA-binding beta-propeller fold protein YncE
MFRSIALATALLAGLALPAGAATLVGLQGDDTLVTFDSATRQVTATVRLQGPTRLHGIDVRPANGMLYGLTRDGRVVTIDAGTGAVTERARLNQPIAADGAYAVDFNPVADRLRVIGQDGASLRINVEDGVTAVDGRIRWAEGDPNRERGPRVVAAVYLNKVRGAQSTTLLDIEAAAGVIVRQAPPNDGVINTVARVEANLSGPVALAVGTDAAGANTAYLVIGSTLSTLDLASGRVTPLGPVGGLAGPLKDVAVTRP